VMPTSAGVRWNRWSRGLRAACSAGDRWNRSRPLQRNSNWSSRAHEGQPAVLRVARDGLGALPVLPDAGGSGLALRMPIWRLPLRVVAVVMR